MGTTELRRHSLGEADLEGALALVAEAGWNQIAADWRLFFDFGTVDGLSTPAGRLVATAATLPYGARFGWISMVLVSVEFRQHGLATRLMNHAIESLRGRGLVPILDATEAGREVYSRIGFQDCWELERLQLPHSPGAIAARAACDIAPLLDADWRDLVAFDTAAFGADRSPVLARLRRRMPGAAFVARRAGRICGYVLARDGRTATQIGPLVAEDDGATKGLLAGALGAAGTGVYIDLAGHHAAIGEWLRAHGFTVQRRFTRMALDQGRTFDDGRRIVAAAGPELG